MSFNWQPMGPPPSQGQQGNPPPPNQGPNPNQGHQPAAPFGGLGLGFQQAAPPPHPFAPQGFNPAAQPFNPAVHAFNPALHPPGFNPALHAPVNPFASNHHQPGFTGAPTNPPSSQASQSQQQSSANNDTQDEDDEEEDSEDDPDNADPDQEYDEASPINLILRVPLNIKGSNNIVAIDAGKLAKQVADAMVASLRNLSVGNSGIPMIDHNGQPRPVSIRVDLKVNVTGDKNTVGEKAVLALVPVAVRQAMLEGVLPAMPLSPLEDKVFTNVIETLRTTGVNLQPESPKLPKHAERHGETRITKRGREASSDDYDGGEDTDSSLALASSPKRSRKD